MTRPDEPTRSDCPISYALEVFGDRWTLIVLRDLMLKSRWHYKELLACEESIATNVLADRLKRLEHRGLIEKARDPDDARQYVYRPTQMAVSLVPMLLEMTIWGAGNSDSNVDPAVVRQFNSNREQLIAEIQRKIRNEAGLL